MSIIFRYSVQRQPPAPCLIVDLANPENSDSELLGIPAQIDTAADRTIIPVQVVDQLGLKPCGELTLEGLGGTVFTVPEYELVIRVIRMKARRIKVATCNDETVTILGRDFLNHFKIALDGPNQRVEVSEP